MAWQRGVRCSPKISQGEYLDECLACALNEVPKGTHASDTQSLAYISKKVMLLTLHSYKIDFAHKHGCKFKNWCFSRILHLFFMPLHKVFECRLKVENLIVQLWEWQHDHGQQDPLLGNNCQICQVWVHYLAALSINGSRRFQLSCLSPELTSKLDGTRLIK